MTDSHYADKTSNGTRTEKQFHSKGIVFLICLQKSILQLSNACKIALFGNAARTSVKGGTGSGCVNSMFVVNVDNGLENAGFTITSKQWLDEYDAQLKHAKDEFNNKLNMLKKSSSSSSHLGISIC